MVSNEIEFINALAPFDHGVWEGKTSSGETIKVGDKALFKSRSTWLVEKIVTYLCTHYTVDALAKMSVLEIGSYDGWVLTQICKKIKFSAAFGVEPRLKNIKKGEVGRRLAKVETQAKFVLGSATDVNNIFPDRIFDIVICLGMLHHVTSTYDTVAALCQKSSNIAIVDSMIIPELDLDEHKIEPFVNTKDIIYQGEENLWSIAAFKYESPYGDGSGTNFGIVNVPTAKLIQMSFRTCGFGEFTLIGDETDFYGDDSQKLRGVKEMLAVSHREVPINEVDRRWIEKVKKSENTFCHVLLPDEIIIALTKTLPGSSDLRIYADIINFTEEKCEKDIENLVSTIVSSGLNKERIETLSARVLGFNDDHIQILSVIFRSPYEKITLEAAKFLLKKGAYDLAIKHLKLIVRKPGCDWWSFYRSCYMLRTAFQRQELDKKANHYQELLMLSNEKFPF